MLHTPVHIGMLANAFIQWTESTIYQSFFLLAYI